ncbi:hypothetical protein [Kitasatospora purpeofusca]|uniref:hypothetical protein n=1 Tax=Kitasatospora purpeofusca TaxID=67352 RepID=UPI00225262FD|nr:hypothetical protein [Kitasatospora purpeofusca]MCX4758633.1 hypothetical protein [Kitasatospora purpeofusca]WSR30931.1 hypothetical protein OG715_08060 [Kitasatospora purpeofusca]
MRGFTEAALGFPTALFSFALLVVIGYWGLVLLGGLGVDALDGGEGVDTHGGALAGLGLGGVPVTVAGSLLIAVAWFVSLAGSVLTTGPAARSAVLATALASAWAGTRAALRPIARRLPRERAASRSDFVGRLCVVRTGRVGADFGQAEVTAQDGSSAVVQVRSLAEEPGLTVGRTALIFDYDPDAECYLVAAFDPGALGD